MSRKTRVLLIGSLCHFAWFLGDLIILAHRVLEWVLLDDFRAPAACT
jgi:hypothetical protein